MSKSRQKIASLEEQLLKIKNELSKERKRAETRRLILVGSCISKAVEENKIPQNKINEILDHYTKNNSDREFLELEPLPVDFTHANSETVNDNNNYQEQPQEYQQSY